MDWELSKKGTLLIPSGPSHDPDRKHLFVVCAINHSEAMLATISKWANDLCDDACILDAGAHPFINAKSYVLYRKCRIEKCQTLKNGVNSGILIPRDPFDDEPFQKVCAGIGQSKQIPWKMKRSFEHWKE